MAATASTIGDRLPQRPRWADMRDSSTESMAPPAAPCVDSQASYQCTMSQDSFDGGSSRADLHHKFLANANIGANNSFVGRGATSNWADASMSDAVGSGAAASAAPSSHLNAAAPAFVPTTLGGQGTHTPVSHDGPAMPSTVFLPTALPLVGGDGGLGDTEGAVEAAASKRRRMTGKRRRNSTLGDPAAAMGVTPSSAWPVATRRRMEGVEDGEAGDEEAGLPPATEEDWQRRGEKRRLAVATIKASADYTAFVQHRSTAAGKSFGVLAPGTPKAEDRSVSKRSWEAGVMRWRTSLRSWAAAAGVSASSLARKEIPPLD